MTTTYHLDKDYDDEKGNPYDYGFGDEEEEVMIGGENNQRNHSISLISGLWIYALTTGLGEINIYAENTPSSSS